MTLFPALWYHCSPARHRDCRGDPQSPVLSPCSVTGYPNQCSPLNPVLTPSDSSKCTTLTFVSPHCCTCLSHIKSLMPSVPLLHSFSLSHCQPSLAPTPCLFTFLLILPFLKLTDTSSPSVCTHTAPLLPSPTLTSPCPPQSQLPFCAPPFFSYLFEVSLTRTLKYFLQRIFSDLPHILSFPPHAPP